MRNPRALAAVLALLTATGWAANHFAAVIPVLSDQEHLSAALLDGVFGVYAVGLLPGLFLGGGLSDRVGRPRVVLPGALVAALGTLLLLAWHEPTGLLLGRLVVGLGAGLTFGAATAWAADLGGTTGTVLAGVFLTSGFGFGPLVSGALAEWAPGPLVTPFVVSAVVSLVAVGMAGLVAVPATPRPEGRSAPTPAAHQSARAALAWSAPVGILVFATATVALLTVPPRLPSRYDGPLLVGIAAAGTLGTGIVAQALARRGGWGPGAGVAGAISAALGFALVSVAGHAVGLVTFALVCVLMGIAYGLSLREGLLDVETLAPPARRGLLTGVFYVITYLGFGLPLLLVSLTPHVGETAPTVVLAVVCALLAAARALQVRRGHAGR